MYNIVIYNNNNTSMDFVVNLLMDVFGYDQIDALDMMLTIHISNSCIVYSSKSLEETENKVSLAKKKIFEENCKLPIFIVQSDLHTVSQHIEKIKGLIIGIKFLEKLSPELIIEQLPSLISLAKEANESLNSLEQTVKR